MKNLSPQLAAALAQDVTTLCRLWAITAPGGEVLRFTDFHSDLTFEGNVYTSTQAFTASATQLVANSAGSDVDIVVLLGEQGLEYQRAERGLFDNAHVELSVVSYKNLDAGAISLLSGAVNSLQFSNQSAVTLSIGPRLAALARPICEQYTAYCRAGFGDDRCKVDLSLYTDPFEVMFVGTSQAFASPTFLAKPDNYYALGTITWLTGANAGTRIDVVTNGAGGGVFTLLPCPMPVQVGDTGTITRGCPKTTAACVGYNNLPNYRGEPYVPGDEGLS